MDELLTRIAAQAGISHETAKQAVGCMLAYMKAESTDPATAETILETPGAEEAMASARDEGGEDFGGGITALGSRLMELGLDTTQIQIAARELVDFTKAHAGETAVDKVIASVPELSQFA